MIIRILGEGQYTLDEADVDDLQRLDGLLLDAADDGDDAGFAEILGRLRASVRANGHPVPDAELVVSDLVLPSADTDLATVRAMLDDDGLIPG
ncbi:PspA-associated protein PspAA [Nocardia seriolae]|uniref:PspA-associated domain-containing protein n=1 Tax=Nocardia seriolae TaxID=37332 RepID=A0A0B8NQH9_9NOCA|nr:hypothetical protein [Nocardia seriolae]MTJ64089.1 hypothetical protein [Nocardia seriolae]MTJ73658.1 hypothetical protein [Nocardia seriolae]MTJ88132.1 hypothetical protein [Nocardia seriolae]MTK41975.1 hypothetical protein [Nocardia seriolae]MTK48701.1 hypothetical protein [Nocardia seriolae]